jgi:nitrogenase subunit NifH
VASFKGGVGKTVTAVHLAAHLQTRASTMLVDGDPNRSATGWAKRGALPFRVVDEHRAVRHARDHEHVVIETPKRARTARTSKPSPALGRSCAPKMRAATTSGASSSLRAAERA